MSPKNDFETEMISFKASTLTFLQELDKSIKEMRKERSEHTKEFWSKFNKMTEALHVEREERIKGDSKCISEIKVIKAIAGFMTLIAGGVAAIVAYFKN